MEKLLVRWSYLLGLLCFAIALVWRALIALGWGVIENVLEGRTIYYSSFYKAGAMFLVISIAAVCYSWYKKQQP
jgi:hypothetical protein